MLKKIIGIMVLISAFLIGDSSISPEEVTKMDFGAKPENIKLEDIQRGFRSYTDPDSVKIDLKTLVLRRGYLVWPVDVPTEIDGKITNKGDVWWTGWVATVEANVKNLYGAYTGVKYYHVPLECGKGIGSYGLTDEEIHIVD